MDRVIREISRTLLKPGPEITDGQLLEMFRVRHNEAAFEAIVHRHGPMVLAVCRRILRNHHDAEDAFQATFLVLARKSGSIALRDMAASWLYGVAVRTAQKARTRAARIRLRELRAVIPIDAQTESHESEFDVQESLDRELARLPEKYRTPIVLCELEGKSHKEAARELRWPEGTLSVRLMRAKKLLAQRLTRQGLGTTAGAIAILAASADVPSALASSSVTFSSLFAAEKGTATIPAKVTVLADEVLRGLFMSKMKALGTIVLLGVLLGGVAYSTMALSAGSQQAKLAEGAIAQAPDEPKKDKVVEKPVVAADGPKARLDSFGDPLPEGAAARLGARRFRHDGVNWRLSFTPDGKNLIGLSHSGVILWDVTTGVERQRMGGMFGDFGVSPDGTTMAICEHLLTGDNHQRFRLLDLRSGKRIRSLSAPESKGERWAPDFFRFSSDGKSLAVCCEENKRRAVIFDLATSEIRASFGGPDSFNCYKVAISPDSKTLATAAISRSGEKIHGLRWWDFATGEPIREVRELPHAVSSMAFSPDGKTLALGIEIDNEILLFNASTGEMTGRLKPEQMERRINGIARVVDMAFTPDSKKLVTGGEQDGAIRIWDLTTGKVLNYLNGRWSKGLSLSLSPDGKTVAFSQHGNVVRLLDVATGKELFTDQLGHESQINALAFSPDGKTLVSGGFFGQTFLWDWASKKRIGFLPRSATVLSFSPDGKRLASLGGNPSAPDKVRIWDFALRKEACEITVPGAKDLTAIFSSDGRKLFTLDRGNAGKEQAVRHWDLATGKQEQSWLNLKDQWETCLAPDGKTVLNSSKQGLSIYDMQTGRQKTVSREMNDGVYSLSPDGRIVGSISVKHQAVCLYEVCTGQEICVLNGHKDFVKAFVCFASALAWSPDGSLVATGDEDKGPPFKGQTGQTVRVWDTATGKQRAVFGGFYSDVITLTFSPDGAFLVAGLKDGTIPIWELAETIPRMPAPTLSKDELDARWTDLISDQAAQAHQAIGALVASPQQTVPFLRDRLRPTPVADASKIQRWIADLDSDQFAVRDSASKELAKVGAQIEPIVRKALKGEVSLETRRRLERILSTLDSPDSSAVRTIRAVTILERIGSSDARAVLEVLAGGAPGAHATEEAAASLQRLARRR